MVTAISRLKCIICSLSVFRVGLEICSLSRMFAVKNPFVPTKSKATHCEWLVSCISVRQFVRRRLDWESLSGWPASGVMEAKIRPEAAFRVVRPADAASGVPLAANSFSGSRSFSILNSLRPVVRTDGRACAGINKYTYRRRREGPEPRVGQRFPDPQV